MNDHRGAPVTLEEMTRRRDGWRVRWDKTDRELQAARAHVRQLTKRLMRVEYELTESQREAAHQTGRASAAEADARRFAQECGRLRDRLAQCDGGGEVTSCPACGVPSVLVHGLNRPVHISGSPNRPCWVTLSPGRDHQEATESLDARNAAYTQHSARRGAMRDGDDD